MNNSEVVAIAKSVVQEDMYKMSPVEEKQRRHVNSITGRVRKRRSTARHTKRAPSRRRASSVLNNSRVGANGYFKRTPGPVSKKER